MPGLFSQLFSPAGLVDLSGRIEITDSLAFAYGGLADIWRGHYKNQPQNVIAVKILRTYVQEPEYVQERNKKLIREAKVWSRFSHKHVVPFFGISFDVGRGQPGAPALICPYYSNGNLTEYLKANPKANVIKLLSEAASAVWYLHSLKPNAIAHGDIKANNGNERLYDKVPCREFTVDCI
ncbi:hypothetical protein EST38_g899 [Candolleomyces aberdarensis]|uniref:Protein kinase domain-containing protein n=1 Tax=Candolleomyces aberdarensis TaxID=2316362 RepID=A0A4Q2E0T3_9AGAR|nr:hypothetical protein EST38_g899 [Candolleomyces aberdarensis]